MGTCWFTGKKGDQLLSTLQHKYPDETGVLNRPNIRFPDLSLTIGKKLFAGMGFLLSLFLISVVVSYLQTQSISKEIKEITEIKTPISETVRDMEIHVLNIATALLRYYHDGNPDYKQIAQEHMRAFDRSLAVYKNLGTTRQPQETVAKINKLFARYQALAYAVSDLHDNEISSVINLLEVSKEIMELTAFRMESALKVNDHQYEVKVQTIKKIENDINLINRDLA